MFLVQFSVHECWTKAKEEESCKGGHIVKDKGDGEFHKFPSKKTLLNQCRQDLHVLMYVAGVD